jgi:hypothetical protein
MHKSKIGGILSIVSGGIGALFSLMWLFFIIMMFVVMRSERGMSSLYEPNFDTMFNILMIFYIIVFILMLICSILSIVGGIFALKKNNWILCLAGSIASIIAFMPCGIASLIFIIQGKDEFEAAPDAAVATQ